MAVFTQFDEAARNLLCLGYGLSNFISFVGICHGDHESSYVVSNAEGAYFLTVFETDVDLDRLRQTFELMDRLEAAGLPCPKPIRTRDGQSSLIVRGKPVAIVSYRVGVSVRALNAAKARNLGRTVAHLHTAFGFPDASGDRCPYGMLHRALLPENVFFVGDEVTNIINYRHCEQGIVIDELARLIATWCVSDAILNAEKAGALLAGYASVRPLTPVEIALLPPLVVADLATSCHTKADLLADRLAVVATELAKALQVQS